jgi:integrase-like protein
MDVTYVRDQPMGVHGLHDWWYGCLRRAGVAEGVTRGERMHKARHTAGQRMLDRTRGNLKAVQRLLGHASIQTTADIYTDWDVDQLADVMRDIVAAREQREPRIVPTMHLQALQTGKGGGGGNRTRVRDRTGQSVYKLRLPFAFTRRPVDSRPTAGLAILRCRTSGDWLSFGAEPVF